MVKSGNTNSEVNPTEALTMQPAGKDWKKGEVLVFINGKKLNSDSIKSFTVQYTTEGKLLVIDLSYDVKDMGNTQVITTSAKVVGTTNKPSTKGVGTTMTDIPEVYDLQEDDLLKLQTMSALRTTKEEDKKPISKLLAAKPKHSVLEELDLVTDSYNISEVTGVSSALNDLALKEQNLQRDHNILKVEIVQKPKMVVTGLTFTIIEKVKVYKAEKKDGE